MHGDRERACGLKMVELLTHDVEEPGHRPGLLLRKYCRPGQPPALRQTSSTGPLTIPSMVIPAHRSTLGLHGVAYSPREGFVPRAAHAQAMLRIVSDSLHVQPSRLTSATTDALHQFVAWLYSSHRSSRRLSFNRLSANAFLPLLPRGTNITIPIYFRSTFGTRARWNKGGCHDYP